MLLAMDVKYKDQSGRERWINTSQALIDEVSYPIILSDKTDSRTARGDEVADALFQK
jgi:hypothetical protein